MWQYLQILGHDAAMHTNHKKLTLQPLHLAPILQKFRKHLVVLYLLQRDYELTCHQGVSFANPNR